MVIPDEGTETCTIKERRYTLLTGIGSTGKDYGKRHTTEGVLSSIISRRGDKRVLRVGYGSNIYYVLCDKRSVDGQKRIQHSRKFRP